MNPQALNIPDVIYAYEKGLLTKAEARSVVLSLCPPARSIADAAALIASTEAAA